MRGRWVVMVAIAAGVGGAGCSRPAPVAPRPPSPPSCPAVPVAPAPTAKVPPADPLAAFDPAGAERMAVVVLMLPGGGDPGVPKQRHEYKLFLAADANSAAVEVDGQPMGAARVQHLSPATLARLSTRAPIAAVRPATVRPRPAPPEAIPERVARARMLPTNMQPATYVPPPNGAPIID